MFPSPIGHTIRALLSHWLPALPVRVLSVSDPTSGIFTELQATAKLSLAALYNKAHDIIDDIFKAETELFTMLHRLCCVDSNL